MTDEKEQPGFGGPPAFPVYPAHAPVFGIPVDFAPSVWHDSGNVKFYLARIDPEIFGRPFPNNINPICQVSMPLNGFANMVVFFGHQLETMMEKDQVLADLVKKMREELKEKTTEQPEAGPSDAG